MGNGVYFLNCTNDSNARRSGIAFYNDIGSNNNNVNEQPEAFVYTDTSGWTTWETNIEQGATFSSGVTLNYQIALDGQSKKQDEQVGTANNGFQTFNVKKDDFRFLFKNSDGYNCYCVYYAFAN